jgi:hypothetical protein
LELEDASFEEKEKQIQDLCLEREELENFICMQFGGLEQGDSEELEKNIYSQILDFF